ncbi:hypothetical protein ACVWU4_000864 [Campylobacter coli]
MKLVNLTPTALNVATGIGTTATIEPSGIIAYVSVEYVDKGHYNNIPIRETVYGDIQGLPEPEEGTMYIVSPLVYSAAKKLGRKDVISPMVSYPQRNW